MIDRELIQWAVTNAAAGAETTPDVDVDAVISYAIYRAEKFEDDLQATGREPKDWLAACLAHVFCLGVACGRAEVVDTEGSE